MKRFLFIVFFNFYLINIGYAQNSDIERGVSDLRRAIQKNILLNDSVIASKKSAIVLANVKLDKKGKFLSSILLYSDSSRITQSVSKAFSLVSSDVWKKFKNIQNIFIPIFFVYDDGESEFCLDWLDINLRKMETNYMLGLTMKPIVTILSEPKRIK